MATVMNLLSIVLILVSIIILVLSFVGEFTLLKIGLMIVSFILGLVIQWFVVRPTKQVAELNRKHGNPIK
jgi:hypothetical protein